MCPMHQCLGSVKEMNNVALKYLVLQNLVHCKPLKLYFGVGMKLLLILQVQSLRKILILKWKSPCQRK